MESKWKVSACVYVYMFVARQEVSSACVSICALELDVCESDSVCSGDLVGQTWDDIIRVMTCATVRFELLSTAHTSPVSVRYYVICVTGVYICGLRLFLYIACLYLGSL